MDEKEVTKTDKTKNVVIVILSIIAAASIGFSIYFGTTGTADYANELRAKIDQLEEAGEQLEASLNGALEEIRVSKDLNEQISKNNDDIKEITLSSNELLAETTQILNSININNLRDSVNKLGQFALEQVERNKQILKLINSEGN